MFLGILGVGHLATTIVVGLLRSGFAAENILLSPRGKAKDLSDLYGIQVADDNASLVDRADVVLLSVRPSDAARAVADLPWRQDQVLISCCAGVAISAFPDLEAQIVRAMPLTAAEINASPTAFYPGLPQARAVLDRLGPLVELQSEADFELATVNAAIYGWAQDLIRQSVEWSVEKGMPEPTARRLIANTFAAAGGLIDLKPQPMQQLLDELVTPGGITELGLQKLTEGDQPVVWRQACEAVLARLITK